MIALLLETLAQLFLIMFLGWLLVKGGILQAAESHVLSRLSLYLLMPCVILNAFQVDFTPQLRRGLLLAFGAALVLHLLLIGFGRLSRKLFHLDEVEEVSVLYSNAATLIIPIVTSVLGPEWVIYSSAFVTVQLIFLWTHGQALFLPQKTGSLKAILGNINITAIAAGLLLLVTGIRFPSIIQETLSDISSMIGPVGMLITGMLIASVSWRSLFAHRRIFLVLALRMLICPALILAILRLSHLEAIAENGQEILLVTFLACTTPSASTVMQFAQIHHRDAEYASAINVLTTLMSIATMPLFVYLYML